MLLCGAAVYVGGFGKSVSQSAPQLDYRNISERLLAIAALHARKVQGKPLKVEELLPHVITRRRSNPTTTALRKTADRFLRLQAEFWREGMALVRDGVAFARAQAAGGRSTGGGYEKVGEAAGGGAGAGAQGGSGSGAAAADSVGGSGAAAAADVAAATGGGDAESDSKSEDGLVE